MSVNMAPAMGIADVSTFSNQWPRPTMGAVPSSGPATAQISGTNRPTVSAATDSASPAIPWVGFVIALVILRILSHVSKG